ncbi:MAG: nucleotidyltransferase domain-containing protein [Nitrososphaerota archaeon]|jgi:predicted nucleotidyltransferase|nr:nucleotidyltransferase domain-containing protein [Nitrososphaerota archaeon]
MPQKHYKNNSNSSHVSSGHSFGYQNIVYDDEHWALLKRLREKTVFLMSALADFHLNTVVHGSIARGDVKTGSDIDIFIPEVQNSFTVETALERAGIPVNNRFIVQATPMYAMKAHIEIDELTTITFPLMNMRNVEREFYTFGGEITLSQLEANLQVAGVDKRLMLIEPNTVGHEESSVIGREAFVAKTLGISIDTVLDRVHALTKRSTVGRTGVFLKKELNNEETFELALKRLSDLNPSIRRRQQQQNKKGFS